MFSRRLLLSLDYIPIACDNTVMDATKQVISDPITVAEACRRLGMGHSGVCKLLKSGRIIGYQETVPGILGPVWRVCPESVAAFPAKLPGTRGRPRGATGLKSSQA